MKFMTKTPAESFFQKLRQKFFDYRVNLEIFNRIFPHNRGEKNHGYSFRSYLEMDEETEQLDSQALLEKIEQQASNMSDAYGQAFRHVMHRDLNARLQMFEKIARRRVNRTCDPRFVAEHA